MWSHRPKTTARDWIPGDALNVQEAVPGRHMLHWFCGGAA